MNIITVPGGEVKNPSEAEAKILPGDNPASSSAAGTKSQDSDVPSPPVAISRSTDLQKAISANDRHFIAGLLANGADVSSQDHNGRTILHKAVTKGSPSIVSLLLDSGADASCQDSNGRTALHYALARRDTQIISLLLKNGVDLSRQDIKGRTALHEAAAWGDPSVIRLLLENGADASCQDNNGRNALHDALSEGDPRVASLLIKGIVDFSCQDSKGRTLLHEAAARGDCSIIQLLLEGGANVLCQDNDGRNALHKAAARGDPSIVSLLLENGADVLCKDGRGRTALHEAALGRDTSVVLLLTENGADVSCQDNNGYTALHEAAAWGDSSIIQLLLENGAAASCQDNHGRTALHNAALRGCTSIVLLILKSGADISCQDNNGHTALHEATAWGDSSIIKLLLENGADASCQDNNGRTALHNALDRGDTRITSLLLKSGAGVSCQDSSGRTALHCAANSRQFGAVTELIKLGADVSCQDNNKRTALHEAAAGGDPPIVSLLVTNRADVSFRDKDGHTPLDLAVSGGHVGVANLLSKMATQARGIRHQGTNPDSEERLGSTTQAVNTSEGSLKKQPGNGGQDYSESPKSATKVDTVSSNILPGSPTRRKPSPFTEDAVLGLGHENEDYEDEDDRDDEDGDNDGDDGDDDEAELEDDDDEMGTSSDDDSSHYSIEATSSRTNNGYVQGLGDREARGGKSGGIVSQDLPTSGGFAKGSKRGMQNEDEDENPRRPNKRRRKDKGGQNKLSDQPKKSFACPYYKNNALEHRGCAEWNSVKLDQVKDHCRSTHLKLRCPRCKVFQECTQEKINQHLDSDDCSKPEIYDPSEEIAAKEKSEEIGKVRTWEKIYEVLFPLHIPDPFWHPTELFTAPVPGTLPLTRTTVPPQDKQAYQLGLAEFLTVRLDLKDGAADELLNEYDKGWISRARQESPNDVGGIKAERNVYHIAACDSPPGPSNTQQSRTLRLVHEHPTSQHTIHQQLPDKTGQGPGDKTHSQSAMVNVNSSTAELDESDQSFNIIDYLQASTYEWPPNPESRTIEHGLEIPINDPRSEYNIEGYIDTWGFGGFGESLSRARQIGGISGDSTQVGG